MLVQRQAVRLAGALLAFASMVGAARADPDRRSAPAPSWDVQQSALCTAAIQAAERRYALPAGLLGTIAKVESGRPITGMGDIRAWPWTIDADGAGLFLQSRAAAVAWAEQGLATGVRQMDVGCLQVNLQSHPGAFRSLNEAFNPMDNADYAARFLRRLAVEANGD